MGFWLASFGFRHRFRFDALNPNVGVVWNADGLTKGQLRTLNAVLRRDGRGTRPATTRSDGPRC